MRSPRSWLPVFLLLFACYQVPEGIGGRWLQQPALAAGLMLAFLPIAWLAARALGFGMGAAYALEWDGRAAALLAGGLLTALVAKALAMAIGVQLGIYTATTGGDPGSTSVPGSLAWLALSTFVPSIAEDILTRGFWLRVPGFAWTGVRFVLITAVLYVLNHIYRLDNGPTEWLMLFCFGLAYATGCWKTGSLWMAVGLHWGWNFAGPALALAWPYDVARVEAGRLLSGAVHVLILAGLLTLPTLAARRRP